MAGVTIVELNDGNSIPQLGLGVWQVPDHEAASVVADAIGAGYQLIDTAAAYRNEGGVGQAIRAAGRARSDLFVTTKLANEQHGYDRTLRAFDASMQLLGLDQLDLYLIHWPQPRHNLYVETWKAFVRLKEEGRIRSIGVSNFNPPHIERLIAETGVVPAVNQIELHPRFQQRAVKDFHLQHAIAIEAWSPLGQGTVLDDPVITAVAEKHGRSPAQVILRWHLDKGHVAIPKSVTPARIRENLAVFDFQLDEDDLARIDGLDANGRIGPDPDRLG